MSDFQKWSVLAFRAMDDAGRVLMTIEPESTAEGERLDQLKETIRELLTQVLLLNGVYTRRQLDERFQFGKLDTDALNVQLGQQQAEPVAYIHRQGNHWEVSERHLVDDEKARGWTEEPLYITPPQRKPLTDEQAQDIVEEESWGPDAITLNFQLLRTIRRTEAAHGIQEPKP